MRLLLITVLCLGLTGCQSVPPSPVAECVVKLTEKSSVEIDRCFHALQEEVK